LTQRNLFVNQWNRNNGWPNFFFVVVHVLHFCSENSAWTPQVQLPCSPHRRLVLLKLCGHIKSTQLRTLNFDWCIRRRECARTLLKVERDYLRIIYVECWSSVQKVKLYSPLTYGQLPGFVPGINLGSSVGLFTWNKFIWKMVTLYWRKGIYLLTNEIRIMLK